MPRLIHTDGLNIDEGCSRRRLPSEYEFAMHRRGSAWATWLLESELDYGAALNRAKMGDSSTCANRYSVLSAQRCKSETKTMRTAGVKKLVDMAMENLPKPYTEDVIEDVFLEIANEPEFMVEYEGLCKQLGKTTVNTWGGYWIANALGKTGLEQVPAKKSKLIQSYSKLTASATATTGKRKEPLALELMSDYYQEHKDRLPPSVRNHRELIVEMLVAGLPVEQAFAMVPLDVVQHQSPVQRRR